MSTDDAEQVLADATLLSLHGQYMADEIGQFRSVFAQLLRDHALNISTREQVCVIIRAGMDRINNNRSAMVSDEQIQEAASVASDRFLHGDSREHIVQCVQAVDEQVIKHRIDEVCHSDTFLQPAPWFINEYSGTPVGAAVAHLVNPEPTTPSV